MIDFADLTRKWAEPLFKVRLFTFIFRGDNERELTYIRLHADIDDSFSVYASTGVTTELSPFCF